MTLAEQILTKCNEYAVITGMHTANVVYIPEEWYNGTNEGAWSVKDNQLILNGNVHVYRKPKLSRICVTYMKDPKDEWESSSSDIKSSFVMLGTDRIKIDDITSYSVYDVNKTDLRLDIYFKCHSGKCRSIFGNTQDVNRWLLMLDRMLGVESI